MRKTFFDEEIKSWSRFYRGNFVNSLSGFKSVSLIGTVDSDRRSNLAVFSNLVHLGADPALIGFINRPREAAPHTLANIEATSLYTINHITDSMVVQAHQTSAKYEEGVSEFNATGLNEEWIEGVPVPFVKESHVKYLLQLEDVFPIKQNGTFLVIGSLRLAVVPHEIISGDGFLHLEQAGSITSLGIDGYYNTSALGRFSYAKTDRPLTRI